MPVAGGGGEALHHGLAVGVVQADEVEAAFTAAVDAMVEVHEKLSAATGGTPFVPPTWTIAKNLITPHPLEAARLLDWANDQNAILQARKPSALAAMFDPPCRRLLTSDPRSMIPASRSDSIW